MEEKERTEQMIYEEMKVKLIKSSLLDFFLVKIILFNSSVVLLDFFRVNISLLCHFGVIAECAYIPRGFRAYSQPDFYVFSRLQQY